MNKNVNGRNTPPSQAAANPSDSLVLPLRKLSLIEWPTEAEIREVSERLAGIKQAGIESESGGDYFKSGNVAFEMSEIIRETAALAKRCQRGKL